MKISIENRAKLACLYAGAVWGLFWIPLRALEDAILSPKVSPKANIGAGVEELVRLTSE